MAPSPIRRGQLAGLVAALLFGISAPLISTLTGAGSALSIAGLLYGGATLALLAVRTLRGTSAETPLSRQDVPALATLTLLGGVVGPVALVLAPEAQLQLLPAAIAQVRDASCNPKTPVGPVRIGGSVVVTPAESLIGANRLDLGLVATNLIGPHRSGSTDHDARGHLVGMGHHPFEHPHSTQRRAEPPGLAQKGGVKGCVTPPRQDSVEQIRFPALFRNSCAMCQEGVAFSLGHDRRGRSAPGAVGR